MTTFNSDSEICRYNLITQEIKIFKKDTIEQSLTHPPSGKMHGLGRTWTGTTTGLSTPARR